MSQNPQSTSCWWIHLEVFGIWFGKQLLVTGKAPGEWQRESEEGVWGVKAVCASQWVLPGRGDCRREDGGRPGLGGHTWCYVVGLVFPHVAFPARRNEWLPTGLWLQPQLKEYTYQSPEYTPQQAGRPVSVFASERLQPRVHLLLTDSAFLS